MEAEELMIGDWLCYEGERNIQIEGIDLPLNRNSAYISFGAEFYPFDDFSPIPLTPEILEKNGFELNPQGSYSIGRNISIDILDGHYNANMNTNNPQSPSFLYLCGKYVHELQHALKLCGIKKEIIL